MSENKEDGGPAFPNYDDVQDSGMTLRDYFAAKALPTVIGQLKVEIVDMENIVETSYFIADAMLKERNK